MSSAKLKKSILRKPLTGERRGYMTYRKVCWAILLTLAAPLGGQTPAFCGGFRRHGCRLREKNSKQGCLLFFLPHVPLRRHMLFPHWAQEARLFFLSKKKSPPFFPHKGGSHAAGGKDNFCKTRRQTTTDFRLARLWAGVQHGDGEIINDVLIEIKWSFLICILIHSLCKYKYISCISHINYFNNMINIIYCIFYM